MYDVDAGVDGATGVRSENGYATPEPPNDRPLVAAFVVVLLLALEGGAAFADFRLPSDAGLGEPIATIPAYLHARFAALSILFLGAATSMIVLQRTRRVAPFMFMISLICGIATVGRIYSPLAFVGWQWRAVHDPTMTSTSHQAWILVGVVAVVGIWLVVAAWRRRHTAPPTASHGSAHWGSPEALAIEHGVLLGRSEQTALRLGGEGHILTVAPTRSGKGVSCVIPNLLDHPGSVLVTDPKGENYAVTAKWRRKQGHVVHALDPFEVVGGDAQYNPVDLVDVAGPDAADDARMLADMLVLPEGREGEQAFWNEEARGVLTGFILHVASSPDPALRTLTHVRTLLTLSHTSFGELLVEMSNSNAVGGLVARAAARLLQKADRERSGVISTAQSHTHFLDSPRMKTVLGSSTFRPADLKRQRISVYLVLPTDRIDGYARWLRLMIACGLTAIARTPGQPTDRILFLLDEFAHLRRIHPVQRDIGLAAGYGVRFWLVVQDLSQLRSTYSETWQTFLANVDAFQAFGTTDWDTAEYL
jgi:type IV secretion system protein VirD4